MTTCETKRELSPPKFRRFLFSIRTKTSCATTNIAFNW